MAADVLKERRDAQPDRLRRGQTETLGNARQDHASRAAHDREEIVATKPGEPNDRHRAHIVEVRRPARPLDRHAGDSVIAKLFSDRREN